MRIDLRLRPDLVVRWPAMALLAALGTACAGKPPTVSAAPSAPQEPGQGQATGPYTPAPVAGDVTPPPLPPGVRVGGLAVAPAPSNFYPDPLPAADVGLAVPIK